LKNIRVPLSREYAVIAAYNGGAGNLFKTFSSGRDSAIKQINKLSSDAVYWKIKTKHPKEESRRYLVKVTTAKKQYR
jgi:membrane-bound lytic murein transglycosylase C